MKKQELRTCQMEFVCLYNPSSVLDEKPQLCGCVVSLFLLLIAQIKSVTKLRSGGNNKAGIS